MAIGTGVQGWHCTLPVAQNTEIIVCSQKIDGCIYRLNFRTYANLPNFNDVNIFHVLHALITTFLYISYLTEKIVHLVRLYHRLKPHMIFCIEERQTIKKTSHQSQRTLFSFISCPSLGWCYQSQADLIKRDHSINLFVKLSKWPW